MEMKSKNNKNLPFREFSNMYVTYVSELLGLCVSNSAQIDSNTKNIGRHE